MKTKTSFAKGKMAYHLRKFSTRLKRCIYNIPDLTFDGAELKVIAPYIAMMWMRGTR
ncbi:hypothetical protein RchiOBHm_Chr1g0328891 [Rosa chinensis]|uniref:Uncharacterized protein n=1 Tax=Rosa chinensis TaxID=74649 RepID=A0A2P6SAX6_ROSCH|nr:hypothetical protein RchiOBHm_Chr1g0328891 [Rosa chinensis]